MDYPKDIKLIFDFMELALQNSQCEAEYSEPNPPQISQQVRDEVLKKLDEQHQLIYKIPLPAPNTLDIYSMSNAIFVCTEPISNQTSF